MYFHEFFYLIGCGRTQISWSKWYNLLFLISPIDTIFESVTNATLEGSVGISVAGHGVIPGHVVTPVALVQFAKLPDIFRRGLYSLRAKHRPVAPCDCWFHLSLFMCSKYYLNLHFIGLLKIQRKAWWTVFFLNAQTLSLPFLTLKKPVKKGSNTNRRTMHNL